MDKPLTERQMKERAKASSEEEENEVRAFLEQDDAAPTPTITEDVYVEPEKPVTAEETVAILQEKIKALEEAVLRGQKPYTKSAEGATVCPDCGSFTDLKLNPLTYGCKNCGASFHPPKPSG